MERKTVGRRNLEGKNQRNSNGCWKKRIKLRHRNSTSKLDRWMRQGSAIYRNEGENRKGWSNFGWKRENENYPPLRGGVM